MGPGLLRASALSLYTETKTMKVKCLITKKFGPFAVGDVDHFPLELALSYERKGRVEVLEEAVPVQTARSMRIGSFKRVSMDTPKQKNKSSTAKSIKVIDAGRGWFMVEVDGEYVMKDKTTPKKFREKEARDYKC